MTVATADEGRRRVPEEPVADRLDARLVLPAATLWAGCFVATGGPAGASPGWWAVAAAAGAAAVVAAMLAGRGHQPGARVTWLALGCLVTGCAVGGLHLAAVRSSGLAGWAADGATANASGMVTSDPVRLRGSAAGGRRGADLVLVAARLDHVVARGQGGPHPVAGAAVRPGR